MINARVLIQVDQEKRLFGRVVGQSLIGNPLMEPQTAKLYLMVELDNQAQEESTSTEQRPMGESITKHKHVWMCETDAQALVNEGLIINSSDNKIRDRSFGNFRGTKVNINEEVQPGTFKTLDGKIHKL